MTTKRDIVRLAFEELGVSAYAGGLAAPLYGANGDSPTLREIVRIAYQELGLPAYNGGILESDFVETLPSPSKQRIIRLAFEQLGVPAYDGGRPSHTSGTGPTVQQVLDQAFAEHGQSVLINSSPTPEEYAFAKAELTAMLAEWREAKGLELGYLPNAGLNAFSGLADSFALPVALALSVRLSVSIGRPVSDDTRKAAEDGLVALVAWFNTSPVERLDGMMAEWAAAGGLNFGYNPAASITDPSGIPAAAEQAVAISLAQRFPVGTPVTEPVATAAAADIAAMKLYYAGAFRRHLRAMLAEWKDAYGIDLGYNPAGLSNDPSGIPRGTQQVVSIGLAMRLAPMVGRDISDDSKGLYGAAFGNLRAFYSSSPYARLDAMMQEWYAAYGLDLGYTFTDPVGANDVATIPPGAVQVVATSLALRLAPALGRQVSPETRKAQADGFASLRVAYMRIPTMQLGRNTVAGAGNRYRRAPFFQPYREPQITENGFPVYEDGNVVVP